MPRAHVSWGEGGQSELFFINVYNPNIGLQTEDGRVIHPLFYPERDHLLTEGVKHCGKPTIISCT